MGSSIRTTAVWPLVIFLMFLAFAGSAGEVCASDDQLSRNSLRGLQGFDVAVEYHDPDAERDGLTKGQIQTDVELRLRKAGIKVLTSEESLKLPAGSPILYVDVHSVFMKGIIPIYIFSIDVELEQDVSLVRSPDIQVRGVTWSKSMMGTIDKKKLGTVRENINDLVDKFINVYLAANPKK